MSDEKEKPTAPQPVSTKPIPRSPLTEMRNYEIARDHALPRKETGKPTPKPPGNAKKK
jgi:hypothetical protein